MGEKANFFCIFALFLIDRKSKKKIYFIFDQYKKIFHLVLKISAIPPVLRNREITGIFNTFDDIYLVSLCVVLITNLGLVPKNFVSRVLFVKSSLSLRQLKK